MFALFLLLMPLIGLLIVFSSAHPVAYAWSAANSAAGIFNLRIKTIALNSSTCGLLVCLVMFALFDYSSNQFQFVEEVHEIGSYSLFLGVDGLSIYFVILTTIIMPVSLLSNWTSLSHSLKSFLITILLLQTLLLLVFLVLDILQFYIFFESILPPLFILIGLFGSSDRIRASFYLFLYTLLGSLFLLLSILTMDSIMGMTDLDALYNNNFNYSTQLVLFVGIFIAFAVKTPVIFLNNWLLKAHVESPLSGSIILAGIVLKLSLYGILRLILPLLPKAEVSCTWFVYAVGVLTIVYASVSTLRTVDVKELIAYSSVSHAAVYLMGVFSNVIQGIEGGITLGLAHGFVSSGLFICAGGVLYDRSSTRLIIFYRGLAQLMPIFCVIFFILCLGNCGAPLTLNFVGEFMSLYGAFENLTLFGALASSSIIFSAAYTIYMFNRIAFAGSYSKFFDVNLPDLNKREFYILLTLVIFTVVLGIYPSSVLDGLHYSVTTLIYYSPQMCVIPLILARTSTSAAEASAKHNSISNHHSLISKHVRYKCTNVGVTSHDFESKLMANNLFSQVKNLSNRNAINSSTDTQTQDTILEKTDWIRSDTGYTETLKPNCPGDTSIKATILDSTSLIRNDCNVTSSLDPHNATALAFLDKTRGDAKDLCLASVFKSTNASTDSSQQCLDKADIISKPNYLDLEIPASTNGNDLLGKMLDLFYYIGSLEHLPYIMEAKAEIMFYIFLQNLLFMLYILFVVLFLSVLVLSALLILCLRYFFMYISDHFRMVFFGYVPTVPVHISTETRSGRWIFTPRYGGIRRDPNSPHFPTPRPPLLQYDLLYDLFRLAAVLLVELFYIDQVWSRTFETDAMYHFIDIISLIISVLVWWI